MDINLMHHNMADLVNPESELSKFIQAVERNGCFEVCVNKPEDKWQRIRVSGLSNLLGELSFYTGSNMRIPQLSEDEQKVVDLQRKVEKLEQIVSDMSQLVDASEGVYGLHSDGPVKWEDLYVNGSYGAWLSTFAEYTGRLDRTDKQQQQLFING